MFQVSNQLVNRLMAIGAVIISVASLYVAVLQTRASQQQVKAETWPYLQVATSNYDVDDEEPVIKFTLSNAGVGPARVESMQLIYQNNPVSGFYDLAQRCCTQGLNVGENEREMMKSEVLGSALTATPSPIILPSESRVHLFLLPKTQQNQIFWERINQTRYELKAKACYCSVLNECWVTNFIDDPEPVKQCQMDSGLDYRG